MCCAKTFNCGGLGEDFPQLAHQQGPIYDVITHGNNNQFNNTK